MSYRTLAEIESDIRFKYDIEGFTSRHPQTNLFRLINDAYRDLRDRLTSDGSLLFVSSTEATQTVTGRTTGYPGTILTAATFGSFEIVHEVHCKVGSSWIPLRHSHLMDALTDTDDSTVGVPQAWALVGLDGETGGVTVTGQGQRILITPPLDAARSFRILGLKAWVDLDTVADRLFSDMGLLEYVVAHVGVVLAQRDDDVALYQARLLERDTVYKDLSKRAKRRDPAPARRVDVRRRHR
jgi:hypothetical protein